jgi:type I restriction enzyme S subunit
MELKKYKLGEIADIQTGPFGSQLHNEDYVSNGTPIVTVEHLGNKFFTTQNLPLVSDYDKKRLSKYVLKANDIVFSRVGSVDRCSFVSPQEDGWLFSGRCLRVRPSDKIDSEWLYYYFTQNYFKEYVRSKAVGCTMPSLNTELLANLDITKLPLDHQRKIASVLSSLDSKISLNRRINAKLETIAKRLYDYWFVQFDFPDANGNPYKSSGGKMVWNDELKREIPEEWGNGILSDVANITMGQSPEGSSFNEEGEGIIFYQGSTDFGLRCPKVRMFTTEPTRMAKQGDVLMSVRAPVGALNISNQDCCIGRGLAAMNSKIGSITQLWFLMDVFKHTFENKNTAGTTFGSITKEELFNLPVVLPPQDIIKAFNAKTLSIFNYQLSIEKETSRLTALRDKLLPLLMNGQVEVA